MLERLKRHSVWTNIFYTIIPLYALMTVPNEFMYIPFISLVLLTIGSGAFHYNNDKIEAFTNTMDWYAMYGVTITLAWYLSYINEMSYSHWSYFAALFLISMIIYKTINKWTLLVITCLILFLSMIVVYTINLGDVLYIGGVFAVAIFLRLGVETKFYDTNPVLQDRLHGLWHFLTAIGFTLILLRS